MFGIGFFEFLLISIVILIFIRPSDLPKFLYKVGRVYGEIKNAYQSVLREINILTNQAKEMIEREEEKKMKEGVGEGLEKKPKGVISSNKKSIKTSHGNSKPKKSGTIKSKKINRSVKDISLKKKKATSKSSALSKSSHKKKMESLEN